MLREIVFLFLFITVLDANSIESQLGINIGMNSTKNETGSQFKNPSVGVTLQYNNYVIMPRFDLEYVNLKNEQASSLLKGSFNGVYEFENSTTITPYILGGVGYENVQEGTKDILESHAFIQGGGGVSMNLPQSYTVNLEGRFLQILGGKDEENEAIITAGISIPLGFRKVVVTPRPIAPRPIIPRPIIPPVRPIVLQTPPRIIYTNTNECSVKTDLPDFDRDGVADSLDQCPATPCHFTVDSYGCPIKTTLKINFATNSANISNSSLSRVDRFSRFLLKNKGSLIKIVGHTDSIGSASSNLSLSKRRANSIVQALIFRGVSSSRIHAIGKGESMPIASNKTAEGRAINRRIEVELSYPQRRK